MSILKTVIDPFNNRQRYKNIKRLANFEQPMKRITVLFALILLFMTALSSCQSREKIRENLLLKAWDTPYGVPPFDRIDVAHYKPAFEEAMSLHNAQVDAITSNHDDPTFENVVLAFDESGRELEQVALIFGMLCDAESTPELQALQEELMPRLAAHDDAILMNERLFEKIKAVYDKRKVLALDALQERLLEKTYQQFVRSGAKLSAEDKARLAQINESLSLLSVKFGNNLLAENNDYKLVIERSEDLRGIPSGVRSAASDKARALGMKDKWVFTLHKPSMIPFLTYAENRALREAIYTAYLNRGNNGNEYDNKQLINDFARLRVEKAHLLGFDSYAAYVLAEQMAKTPKAAYKLLNEVWTPALESAKDELSQMEALFRQDHSEGGEFASWDWWYYAERLRKQKYALDEQMLQPYFSLGNVRGGIFFLANRLYGITFRPISVPLYHPEATAYEVLDRDESHLGVLYFDFFTRAGKSQGAWCGNYVEQSYKDGKRIAPVVSIVTNFNRPSAGNAALLTLDEVETLFHEFGHALHFLFHDVKYRGLSEVEGDFVELPSQVMENWAFEPEVLRHYATHYRTNEVIPQYMIDKIRRSELFNQGFMTTELVAAALSDLDIHSMTEYKSFDPMAFETEALNAKRGLIPQIQPRYRYPYFAHIFSGGYSAGYYFYIWAEVLDKDAFAAYKESGDLFNRKIADAFRYKLLARGGEQDGMTLYRAFRGQDPDKCAMLKARGLWKETEPELDEQNPAIPVPQILPTQNVEKQKAEN